MNFLNLTGDGTLVVPDEEIAKSDVVKNKISVLLEQEPGLEYAYKQEYVEERVVYSWLFKEDTVRFHRDIALELRVTFNPETEPIFEIVVIDPNCLDYYKIYSWEVIEDDEIYLVVKRMETLSRFWKERH